MGPPYMVIPQQSVLQLAAIRPSKIESLRRVQGFNDAKIEKYGDNFIKVVVDFGAKNPDVKLDDFIDTSVTDEEEAVKLASLTEIVKQSYFLFKEKKDMEAVAALRGLKAFTIGSHLSPVIEAGVDIDIVSLGVTPEIMSAVAKVIHDPPINSDVTRLAPIKNELDLNNLSHVGWEHLKLVISRLKVEQGLTPEGSLAWTEDQYKSYLSESTTMPAKKDQHSVTSTSASRLQDFRYTPTKFGSPLKDSSNLAATSSNTAQKKEGNGDNVRQNTAAPVNTSANDSSARKRKLPNWMMDNEQRSKEMQARMKKNSLFK